MSSKAIGTVVIAAAGVASLWLGLRWVCTGFWSGLLPINVLGFVCGLAALVVGEWLCWQAAARHVAPPVSAGRIANVTCAVSLGALLLAAGFLSIYHYGIS